MLGGTGAQAASAGARSAWAYKVATGTTGEDPSFTGAADEWLFTAYVIGDVAAAPFGASPASGTDYVRSDFDFSSVKGRSTSGALTTATDNCLALYGWCLDGSNVPNTYMRVSPGEIFTDAMINNSDTATTIAHTTGHVQMGAAGAAQTAYGYASRQDGGNCWVIAVRNATSGKLQKDCRAGCEPIKWFGNFGETYETLTYNALSYVTTDTINGNAISTTAGTVTHSGADQANPPGAITQVTTAANSTDWQGIGFDVPSTSYAGKVISFQWEVSSLSTGTGNGVDGWIVILSDGTNWRAYRFAYPAQVGLAAFLPYKTQIAVDAATEYASSGTLGDVTKVGFGHHRTGAGTRTFDIKNFMLIDQAKLIGGNATTPVQMSYWGDAMVAGGLTGIQQLQGAGQMLGKSKIQIGDGATPTYFDLSAQSFEFPFAYDAAVLSKQWNADANSVGFNVKASTFDTINLTAGVLATSTAQPLTIDAASGTPTLFSSAGTSFIGWTISDNKGLHWQSATIKSGGTFTMAAGGDLTNCAISNTTSTHAPLTITANGTVVTTSTITVADTSVLTDYHISLGASVTSLTLNGVTLSGTTNSTGSDNIYSALASGTLTITVDGTGTALVAGDVTFVGGSTAVAVIAAPQPTLSATVLANTRVLLWNRTTAAELGNTLVAGTSWSKIITSGASSGDVLDLYTFKEGYEESVATIIYSGANASFAVSQATDATIQYYRTEESITDYTTLTEFNFYAPDIYIQSDDPDGATALKRLFIYYNGILTTADGATYLRGSVTFRSAFDVVINRSITGMQIDNVSVTLGLYFSDEATIRVTTDDGTSWIAPPSAPGSIRYAFGVSPGQIETGVSGLTGPESTQLMALTNAPSAATNAAAVRTELTTELGRMDAAVSTRSTLAAGAAMTLTAAYDAAKTAAMQTSVDDIPTNAELATALGAADDAMLAAILRAEKFARNKQVLDPATGARVVYDDDGTTVLGQGNAFMDAAGTQLYDGTGPVHRTERLA